MFNHHVSQCVIFSMLSYISFARTLRAWLICICVTTFEIFIRFAFAPVMLVLGVGFCYCFMIIVCCCMIHFVQFHTK